MKVSDTLHSEFGEIPKNEDLSAYLSNSQKLHTSGSTCDTYVAQYNHRKVFIKKLKPEFEGNLRYRLAFQKEYELGASLSHKAFPVYLSGNETTIVINYIDGATLRSMLDNNSEWLLQNDSPFKILSELLEAVEYLHEHNVIHCDIKPDNIMIAHGTRNVMLVDLDKAFTFWHAHSAGSNARFGLEESDLRSPQTDFNGIGAVAATLARMDYPERTKKRLQKFADQCFKENTSVSSLKSNLKIQNNSVSVKLPFLFAGVGLAILTAMLFVVLKTSTPDTSLLGEPSISESISGNSANTESVEINEHPSPLQQTQEVRQTDNNSRFSRKSSAETDKFPSETEINTRLNTIFLPLQKKIEEMDAVIETGGISKKEMTDHLYAYNKVKYDCIMASYKEFMDLYPEANQLDVQWAVASSKTFKKYDEEDQRIFKLVEAYLTGESK